MPMLQFRNTSMAKSPLLLESCVVCGEIIHGCSGARLIIQPLKHLGPETDCLLHACRDLIRSIFFRMYSYPLNASSCLSQEIILQHFL